MGAYNKYDARVDSLVMETRTYWDPEVADLSPEDRELVAEQLHANPWLASNINYERSHTGFIREITVGRADIERLYEEKVHG